MMSFEESGEKDRAEAPHADGVSGRCSRSNVWRSRTRLGFRSFTEDFTGKMNNVALQYQLEDTYITFLEPEKLGLISVRDSQPAPVV